MNLFLRKCKSLSRQLSRSSSYSSLRSKSSREETWVSKKKPNEEEVEEEEEEEEKKEERETIYVGRARKRYLVSSEYLTHPLVKALIEKPNDGEIVVRCEVVLFDHLLWMLQNSDPNDSLEDLAYLYVL